VIYIDTHVAAWLYAGDLDRFPARARDLMESNELLISPMAILELQYLREIERLTVDAAVIVQQLESAIDLRVCKLPFHRVSMESVGQSWTRDPFDRIIVAHAITTGRPLLTKDDVIRQHCGLAAWD
jgi:PIN domain nuclease of toxin-antitoxin system